MEAEEVRATRLRGSSAKRLDRAALGAEAGADVGMMSMVEARRVMAAVARLRDSGSRNLEALLESCWAAAGREAARTGSAARRRGSSSRKREAVRWGEAVVTAGRVRTEAGAEEEAEVRLRRSSSILKRLVVVVAGAAGARATTAWLALLARLRGSSRLKREAPVLTGRVEDA